MAANNVEFRAKENNKLPAGSTILERETNLVIEEIENGFLITKNIHGKYLYQDVEDYFLITKKYYSKDNPLDLDEVENKYVAENFE